MSERLARVRAGIGETRRSDWLLVDQAMIDRFADATLDRQFIHVEPARAAATPFGGTIAHGFLILSLLSFMLEATDAPEFDCARMRVNYGFDRVRFTSPVRSGSLVRAASVLVVVDEPMPLAIQLGHDVTVEIRDEPGPALVARWLTRLIF